MHNTRKNIYNENWTIAAARQQFIYYAPAQLRGNIGYMSRKNVDIDILGKSERERKERRKEGRRLATAESKRQKGR